nr:hypothetical protein [Chitinophagaceae bacterium]
MRDEYDIELSNKIELYRENVLSNLLPNAEKPSLFSMRSPNQPFTNCSLSLGRFNTQFKGSKFEYKGDYMFVHYTKISSLISMLINQSIWLTSLNCMDDNWEFHFAYQTLKRVNSFNLNQIRSQLFSISFCKYSEEQLYNKVMWDIYARNIDYCCIVFSINSNNTDNWGDFSLGTIQYKKHDLTEMEEIEKFRDETHEFSNEHKLGINNYSDFLSCLLAHYKINIYKHEDEIRLLKYCEKSQGRWFCNCDEKQIKDVNNKKYYELPFKSNNPYHPNIKIEKVILHPAI